MCAFYSDDEYEHLGRSEMTARPASSLGLWPLPPGSLASSEGIFRPNAPDHVPYFSESCLNSGETTSLTSFEETQDSINIHPNHGPIAPQPDDGLLEGIDGKYVPLEGGIPQNLDDLPISRETSFGQPSDSSLATQPHIPRPLLGVPDSIDSMPIVPQSLQHAMHQVITTVSQVSNNACNLEQLSKGIESLDIIKNFFNTKSMPPPPSTTASREPGKQETHKCPLCPSTSGYTFGSFKRHLDIHGIRECEYRCPQAGCDKKSHRRDRARSHYQSHGHYMSPAEVPLTRVHFPFPSHCPVCLDKMSSWGAFWKHIRGHSTIRRGSGGPSISADSNHRDSDISGNGGSADCPGRGSSAAGPSSLPGQHNQTGNHLYPNSHSFGNPMWLQNNTRPSYSVRDDQLSVDHRDESNFVTGDHFAAPFNSRRSFSAGVNQQSNESLQDPGSSQAADQSTKRKRSSKEKQPKDQKPSSSRKCTRCNHDIAKCKQCCQLMDPIRGCHKCSEDSAGGIQIQAPSQVPGHSPQAQAPTFIELDPNYYDSTPVSSFGQGQDTQMLQYLFNPGMQYHEYQTQMQSFPSERDSFDSNSHFQDPLIRVAMIVQEHAPLRDLSSKVQEPSVFDCDSKLLRKIGLDSFIGPLSKIQHEGAISEAPSGPRSASLSDIVPKIREPPAAHKSPEPSLQCNCPCVRLAPVQYQAHAGAKLSPLERVEMTFKMSPESPQASHSLRTRVQVFVRLFRIRSKVAEMRSKKTKRRLSIQSRAASDDGYNAGSDTDSAYDISPTPVSGSQTAPLIQCGEEVQDWSFSVDIGWIIASLSQWARGIDANMCADIFDSDPGCILDFVSLYIMYKFMYKFKMSW
ncbi:hypothetical protein N7467_006225 [Penicillium canescens]|nr:hypothetical protein N7467_006225 [Penicillium canescens]